MTIRFEVMPQYEDRWSMRLLARKPLEFPRLDGAPVPPEYQVRDYEIPIQEFATGLGSFRVAFDPHTQTLYLGEARPGREMHRLQVQAMELRGALRRAVKLLDEVKGVGSRRRRAMGRLRRFLATWAG